MEQQDKRMNLTTETFTNIKTADWYSYKNDRWKEKQRTWSSQKKVNCRNFHADRLLFFPATTLSGDFDFVCSTWKWNYFS